MPIRLRVEYQSVGQFLDDYASNLSMGGMFVQTEDPLDVGTRFRLRFAVPEQGGSQRDVETIAVVRWVNPPGEVDALNAGMGIQFEELDQADRRAVDRWLRTSTAED